MANLKDKIFDVLKYSGNIEDILNELSKYREILLKSNSNPVFNDSTKNKILEEYKNLEILGKSLYRYNLLKENNITDEAEKEKAKILKGGISYNNYIWRSENNENTCDECSSLDGQIFESMEDVPERPHPNCKCTVEIFNGDINIPSEDNEDEPCDVIYEIETMISKIETIIEETEKFSTEVETDIQDLETNISLVENLTQETESILEILLEEYEKHLPDCENNIDIDYQEMYSKKMELQILLKDIYGLLTSANAIINTIQIFLSNYFELLYYAYILKEKEMDKFYHSKANCEATQELGIVGKEIATALSDFKEIYDQYTYVHTHKVTIEEAIADSERDQAANRLGRERGRKYPYCDCATLMHDLLPDYKK